MAAVLFWPGDVKVPEDRRTFNPDGSRVEPLTEEEQRAEDELFAKLKKRYGDKVQRRQTPPFVSQETEGLSAGLEKKKEGSIMLGWSGETAVEGKEAGKKGKGKGLLKKVLKRQK